MLNKRLSTAITAAIMGFGSFFPYQASTQVQEPTSLVRQQNSLSDIVEKESIVNVNIDSDNLQAMIRNLDSDYSQISDSEIFRRYTDVSEKALYDSLTDRTAEEIRDTLTRNSGLEVKDIDVNSIITQQYSYFVQSEFVEKMIENQDILNSLVDEYQFDDLDYSRLTTLLNERGVFSDMLGRYNSLLNDPPLDQVFDGQIPEKTMVLAEPMGPELDSEQLRIYQQFIRTSVANGLIDSSGRIYNSDATLIDERPLPNLDDGVTREEINTLRDKARMIFDSVDNALFSDIDSEPSLTDQQQNLAQNLIDTFERAYSRITINVDKAVGDLTSQELESVQDYAYSQSLQQFQSDLESATKEFIDQMDIQTRRSRTDYLKNLATSEGVISEINENTLNFYDLIISDDEKLNHLLMEAREDMDTLSNQNLDTQNVDVEELKDYLSSEVYDDYFIEFAQTLNELYTSQEFIMNPFTWQQEGNLQRLFEEFAAQGVREPNDTAVKNFSEYHLENRILRYANRQDVQEEVNSETGGFAQLTLYNDDYHEKDSFENSLREYLGDDIKDYF